MNAITFLASYWHWNIPSVIIIVMMILFHLISNRFRLTRNSLVYFSGVVLFLVSTLSPLAYLARFYLFSAQMVTHIFMLLIIPPLLIAGTDKSYLERILNTNFFKRPAGFLFNPVVTWFIGLGAMWAVHSPFLTRWLMSSAILMNLEMLALLLLGVIFIWPVFSPNPRYRLHPLAGSAYLFLACVGCTLLGILIVSAPEDMFTDVMKPGNPLVIQMIRHSWGISWHMDQVIGGLIMWVPACIVYLTYVVIILLRWFTSREQAATEATGKL